MDRTFRRSFPGFPFKTTVCIVDPAAGKKSVGQRCSEFDAGSEQTRQQGSGVAASIAHNGITALCSSEVSTIPEPCGAADTMYIISDSFNNNNYVTKMDVDSARAVAEDYIRYRLESNGLHWQNGHGDDVPPNDIQRAMRALGDEFETRFSQTFDNMINHLHITLDTAYQTFQTIVNEIFSDGVNWGRVVALFGFGGKLAVRCVQQSMPQLVNSIVDWVANYVDTTLTPWMSANNGWEGFLQFYEGGPENRSTDSWPSFKTICSYAAAGLGILTLGAFLSQKS